jgi:GNAT superfamily N-acetyltransferase
MKFQLRKARSEDVNSITAIKRLTWPDEECDPAQVSAALSAPTHQAHVAEAEGQVVGFVDGFLTRAAAGLSRWEVDLLAIDPQYRRRGLGSRLVSVSTQAGIQSGGSLARALIHVENHSSASVFTRSGYKPQSDKLTLMVLGRDTGLTDTNTLNANLHLKSAGGQTPLDKPYLVPVNTINYTGLWQENHFTHEGFAAARRMLKEYDCQLVGAVIPVDDKASLATAGAAGFESIGNYRWWVWFGV